MFYVTVILLGTENSVITCFNSLNFVVRLEPILTVIDEKISENIIDVWRQSETSKV